MNRPSIVASIRDQESAGERSGRSARWTAVRNAVNGSRLSVVAASREHIGVGPCRARDCSAEHQRKQGERGTTTVACAPAPGRTTARSDAGTVSDRHTGRRGSAGEGTSEVGRPDASTDCRAAAWLM